MNPVIWLQVRIHALLAHLAEPIEAAIYEQESSDD